MEPSTPSTSAAADAEVPKGRAGKKGGLRLAARLRLLSRTRAAKTATAPARFVAGLPAVVENKRIAKLKAAAEAAPEDVAKNDAYLAALVQKR